MLADMAGIKAHDSNCTQCFKANEDGVLTNTRRCLFCSHTGGRLRLDGEWFMSQRRYLGGNAEALESLGEVVTRFCQSLS